MQELQLMHQRRVSRKHRAFYANTAYKFTALGSELVSAGNGYDDAGARRFTVIGSKHLPQQEQASALRDYYSYSRCTHDYDCCGCLHTSARVIPKGRGRFSVLVHGYRNY